jgi:hypothetical protein
MSIYKVTIQQTVKFLYEGKQINFSFLPEEEDWWVEFEQHGFKFDVHYLEDEDREICVYLVKDGKTQTGTTIHKQKIF